MCPVCYLHAGLKASKCSLGPCLPWHLHWSLFAHILAIRHETPLLRHGACQGLIKPILRKSTNPTPFPYSVHIPACTRPCSGFWSKGRHQESDCALICNHSSYFNSSKESLNRRHDGWTQGKAAFTVFNIINTTHVYVFWSSKFQISATEFA